MRPRPSDKVRTVDNFGYRGHHFNELPSRRPLIRPLLVSSGPSHVVVIDHAGAHSHGALWSHHPDRLRDWDIYLDSLDAANEDSDGRLPAPLTPPAAIDQIGRAA